MAKTKISEWSATPASNTDIDGINIAEGCAPSGINDAIREMMAQVKDLYSGTTGDAIAIAGGGTGATTASAARTALGIAIGTDVQAYSANLTAFANGPAFSAYASAATTLSNSNFTKVLLATEVFDTNSNFASSRFTPTVEGYYQIEGTVGADTTATASSVMLSSLFFNGSRYKDGSLSAINNAQGGWSTVSSVIYFNGSTDYVELYGYLSGPATLATQASQNATHFSGAMIRSST